MKSNNERRYHKRFKYEAFISHDVSSNDIIHPGKMFNFSKGGLYFESDEPIYPDEEIFVLPKLALPDSSNTPIEEKH